MKVAITGASGFVGSHLKEKYKDHIVINRTDSEDEIVKKLDGVDAVFNLAGAPIVKRWSKEYKKVLLSSRVETTSKVVGAINRSSVRCFISASAIGIYPEGGPYDENCENYRKDFVGMLIEKWENEASKCTKPTAILRIGIVLGKDGGPLAKGLWAFKLGLGGTIGNGDMMMSWIDIDDLVAIFAFIVQKQLTGIINATAPNPVSNYEFTKAIGKHLHRPTFLPVPIPVLKLIFGEGSSVLTSSQEVLPNKLLENGFGFKYKTIDESLTHLTG